MLMKRFAAICESTPGAIAVVDHARQLTYSELDRLSTAIAARLLERGLPADPLVAVFMERTATALGAMLGIMKAGAAYTIVEDENNLDEHITRLHNISADVVLCEASREQALRDAGLPALAISAEASVAGDVRLPELGKDDVAYVLFTSGSTGKPKGVSVTHGNIEHYTSAIREVLSIDEPMRYAHVSTLAADLGNTSLLLSLATGGRLDLIGAHLRKDPGLLRNYLVEQKIDFIKITPTHWNAIFSSLGADGLSGLKLRRLVLGGEALTVALARRILESGTVEVLSNHYGPTETTVGVTAYPIRSLAELDAISTESIPIGRPLGSSRLLVRGDDERYTARGMKGELFIGGPSVSKGYRGRDDLTEAVFKRIDGEEGLFYKTGDFVSIDDNGVVTFLGRIDRQVKVNGYRVELEHIESVLRALDGVEEGAVYYLDTDGRKRLVAAMLIDETATSVADVRREMERALPDYMVPKVFLPMTTFPRNANGKVDMKALQAIVVDELSRAKPETAPAGDLKIGDSPLHQDIRTSWRRYMGNAHFGDDENFFDLGGDSLDAIQMIADLQMKGHAITAYAFLATPTIDGLVAAITKAEGQRAEANAEAVVDDPALISAAQSFFLRQELSSPDWHNQAVLLSCGARVDAHVMHRAVVHLFENHPSLRMAFHKAEGQWQSSAVEHEPEDAFEVVFIRNENDEAAVRSRIERVAQAAHESLSLGNGDLFKVRLFKFATRPDQLLFVSHHIAVDVISWRILVAELSALYADLAEGREVKRPARMTTFKQWVAHVDGHRELLADNAGAWLTESLQAHEAHPLAIEDRNTEGAATSLWVGYTREQTAALVKALSGKDSAPLHQALLGVFANCYARHRGLDLLSVEVESHGRATFDDSLDISRIVGWHTSTYPIAIPVAANDDVRVTAVRTAEAMNAIPDLGIAFGVEEKLRATADAHAVPASDICYNYLGDIDFASDDRFPLSPSSLSIGRGRGDDNQRGHRLKLSGRIIDGRLIIDLSYDAAQNAAEVEQLMIDFNRALMALGHQTLPLDRPLANILHEKGTRTGMITYVPPKLVEAIEAGDRGEYGAILFTGASGFVGSHVVRELLYRSQAKIYCIVRRKNGSTPAQRLKDTFDAYFPTEQALLASGRVEAIEGDVTAPRFGLTPEMYEQLTREVDAIYHFSADTRLFGREDEFEQQNVAPVRRCIEFSTTGKRKDLHYMSTLAVAGVNPRDEIFDYSESCGDYGQEFQNHYEATKYRAECLVQEFRQSGGRGFIYRSGNVSGHSKTGRFQLNARDNRFIQFVIACVKAGQLPVQHDDPIVLSPIDEVAAGIAAISLDNSLEGGVWHVDNIHAVTTRQVFEALRELGVGLEASDHDTFANLFSAIRDASPAAKKDQELSLGLFWAMRKPRNVRYDNAYTHQVLARHDCTFSKLDDAWVRRFVTELYNDGVFAVQEEASLMAG